MYWFHIAVKWHEHCSPLPFMLFPHGLPMNLAGNGDKRAKVLIVQFFCVCTEHKFQFIIWNIMPLAIVEHTLKESWVPEMYTFCLCGLLIYTEKSHPSLQIVVCGDVHLCIMNEEHTCVCVHACTSMLCVYFHSYGLLLMRTDVGKPTNQSWSHTIITAILIKVSHCDPLIFSQRWLLCNAVTTSIIKTAACD